MSKGYQEHPMHKHKGWNYRGYLPHCDEPEKQQFITYRLNDALPKSIMAKYEAKQKQARLEGNEKERIRIQYILEKYLDQGFGACHLRRPEIATIVENAFQHFHKQRYDLIAWTIMPNHVHVLIGLHRGWPLGKVVQSWKGYTAGEINKVIGGSGKLWQKDYFDRYIRNEDHFWRVVNYIDRNPCLARLVERPEDWRFGSARLLDSVSFGEG